MNIYFHIKRSMETTKLFLFMKTGKSTQELKKLKWTIIYHQTIVDIVDLTTTSADFHFKDDPDFK